MKIRLITACGCEQIVEAAGGRTVLMPLRVQQIGHVDDVRIIDIEKIWDPKPTKYETRAFVLSPYEDRDGIRTYREDFRPGATP